MIARLFCLMGNAVLAIGGGVFFSWLMLNWFMGCGEPGGYCWPFEWWR